MSLLKSFAKSVCSRPFLAMSSALVMVAGMLFGANIATADSVWVQSYERTSQTEACSARPGETPWQESWGTDPSWSSSWEQWANNGNGGWVCTRSITWARSPLVEVSSDASCDVRLTYSVGDIGPGCGLVFLISGGKTYEMAPSTWSGASDPTAIWTTTTAKCFAAGLSVADQDCQSKNLYPETSAGAQTASTAAASAVGMGSANTNAIIDRMNAGSVALNAYAAGATRAYNGGSFTDWFLPSKDELNAMYTYSRVSGFDTLTYGFASAWYWSSSQIGPSDAWAQYLGDGNQYAGDKSYALRVRPVRAF